MPKSHRPLELELARSNVDGGIIIANRPEPNVLRLAGTSESRFGGFIKTPRDMLEIVDIRRISKVIFWCVVSKCLANVNRTVAYIEENCAHCH